MSLTEKVKGLVVGEVDAKNFLMIRMDEAVIFRPKQTISHSGRAYEISEQVYATSKFSADLEDIFAVSK